MISQIRLFPDDDLHARFVEWLRSKHGRQVEAAFRDAALRWHRAGHNHCSAKLLAEVIRWEAGLAGRDPDGLKINNSYVSRLHRHISATTPQLPADFFTARVLREDRIEDRLAS